MRVVCLAITEDTHPGSLNKIPSLIFDLWLFMPYWYSCSICLIFSVYDLLHLQYDGLLWMRKNIYEIKKKNNDLRFFFKSRFKWPSVRFLGQSFMALREVRFGLHHCIVSFEMMFFFSNFCNEICHLSCFSF